MVRETFFITLNTFVFCLLQKSSKHKDYSLWSLCIGTDLSMIFVFSVIFFLAQKIIFETMYISSFYGLFFSAKKELPEIKLSTRDARGGRFRNDPWRPLSAIGAIIFF